MNKFNFEEVQKRLIGAERETLVLLSNQAQNYFLSSFRKQGFDGKTWQEVQRRDPSTKAYKYPKTKGLQRRTSPILVGAGFRVRGGKLRRAVSSIARTAEINTSSGGGNSRLRMVVDLPYAKIQNEGGTIKKGASRKEVAFRNGSHGRKIFASVNGKKGEQATGVMNVKVAAHDIKIPQRRFVGQTNELTQMQIKKIDEIILRIWK